MLWSVWPSIHFLCLLIHTLPLQPLEKHFIFTPHTPTANTNPFEMFRIHPSEIKNAQRIQQNIRFSNLWTNKSSKKKFHCEFTAFSTTGGSISRFKKEMFKKKKKTFDETVLCKNANQTADPPLIWQLVICWIRQIRRQIWRNQTHPVEYYSHCIPAAAGYRLHFCCRRWANCHFAVVS